MLALAIGFYMGYGSLPDHKLVLYFSVYALVAGLAAIFYKLFTSSSEKISQEKINYRINNSLEDFSFNEYTSGLLFSFFKARA